LLTQIPIWYQLSHFPYGTDHGDHVHYSGVHVRLPSSGLGEINPGQLCHAECPGVLHPEGAQLTGFIKPSVTPPAEFLAPADPSSKDKAADPEPNSDYEKWVTKD
jgi:hypothetical protein